MKPKIFIDGEHGTTGLQIRVRMAGRTDLELLSIPEAERRNAAMREDLLNSADIAILCLPDDASREAVAMVAETIACASSTLRPRIASLPTGPMALPRWTRRSPSGSATRPCRQSRLLPDRSDRPDPPSAPGGYPAGWLSVTVNAVSGYTGGGKQMIAQMEDDQNPDHIGAPHFLYGLTLKHKHVPEMKMHGLLERAPVFSPSVGKFAQGMIVQVPLYLEDLAAGATLETIHRALVDHYAGQSIVEVVPLDESAKLARIDATELAGSDAMKLFVFGTKGGAHVNLVALLDNLGKGASGAAVQNMDLMLSA